VDAASPCRFPVLFLAAVIPFVAFGCALPTRYQYQHWFAFVPFLVVGIVEGWRLTTGSGKPARWLTALILGVAVVNVALTAREYTPVKHLAVPDEWFTTKLQKEAHLIRPQVSFGKVLTLAPTWPIEAGVPIFPEFGTGTFTWRLAHLATPAARKKYHLVAPDDLATLLAKDPPAGILTGVEDDHEEARLIEWAETNRYRKMKLDRDRRLWLPPEN
jgi:hypothetical protein